MLRTRTFHQAFLLICGTVLVCSLTSAQVPETDKRYVRVGTLQTKFNAYGSDRAYNEVYYEGLQWPADYLYTDNSVIERQHIGCEDFTDIQGTHWDYYCVQFSQAQARVTTYPVSEVQISKFELPFVYVDGTEINAPYRSDYSQVDPNLICDRMVINVVNTTMGVTLTRRILAFSQQYHDNYYIKEYTFKNTGYVDYTTNKVFNKTIKGFRFGMGIRYSVCREGAFSITDGQDWGKHSWVTKRGEDYPAHANDKLTEASPIPQWLRAGYEWAGQASINAFDNIGGPFITGSGRFRAPQFAGHVVLHVDKSTTDRSDDPNQPPVLGWHAGDTWPLGLGDLGVGTPQQNTDMYKMLSGIPYEGLGNPTQRMDEVYMKTNPDPETVHGDVGGTNIWMCYGPWDLAPGDSIVIVLAEGVSGLTHEKCDSLGWRYLQAYRNSSDKGPFVLPDGSTTTDKDVYKDTWIYTGRDSIMKTFSRAKRNYDLGFQIPQPPLPPPIFNVTSGGDRVSLSWEPSPSRNAPGFGGYILMRATGKPDTTYQRIATVGPDATSFDDVTAQRGFSYYYYISAFFDGTNNTSGGPNPTGPLVSSRFYTKTNQPAYLQRIAGQSLSDIRIVPNPYNIASPGLQYPGEPDKIMFLNIPGHCTIRIYTENGDLINTINHENGSGDEMWNSNTSSRQVIVSGIYIVHFTVTQDYHDPVTGQLKYSKGQTAYQKFVVIR